MFSRRLLTSAALVGLALLLVASLYLGSKDLSIGEVTSILMHGPHPSAQSGINAEQSGIIWDLRVPRTLLAVITGAALAMAGAIARAGPATPWQIPALSA